MNDKFYSGKNRVQSEFFNLYPRVVKKKKTPKKKKLAKGWSDLKPQQANVSECKLFNQFCFSISWPSFESWSIDLSIKWYSVPSFINLCILWAVKTNQR